MLKTEELKLHDPYVISFVVWKTTKNLTTKSDSTTGIKLYDAHMSDDFVSNQTREYIDYAMTSPNYFSYKYNAMFICRRDGKSMVNDEVNSIEREVIDNLQDFIDDSDPNKKYRYRIVKKMASDSTCLILGWDDLELPRIYSEWDEVIDDVVEYTTNNMNQIMNHTQHDKKLALYGGNIDQIIRMNKAEKAKDFPDYDDV